ncbi:MAG: VIT1/CCC1 transporter family protein [Marinobacter sp.]|uniref:VIT1/CCC1 transporter family protein n=1 Tax=Marinobacter sp. TaxID=50741 RepID=UPI00299E941E|nr:VIT1/CCC1 transporter family protein [Marinobacter sp.]MDX1634261.1 VIT1/CCC1 transporter family protein [Marinobacter sp.]
MSINNRAGNGVGRLARKYLSDLVYGANDGLITTFAIVAGVTGAALSAEVVLILGFASLLADGFSMATSDYLAERTPTSETARTGKREAARHGVATFVGFIFPGVVPLLAYLMPLAPDHRFPVAALLTLVTLFFVGAGRAAASDLKWWVAGLEMLLVGLLAASVAYGVGAFGAWVTGGIGMPAV